MQADSNKRTLSTARARIAIATAVAVVVGFTAFAVGTAGAGPTVGLPLLPDVHAVPLSDVKDCADLPDYCVFISKPKGKRLLHFSSVLSNRGPGPMEVFPDSLSDCTPDSGAANGKIAYQQSFVDSDGNGIFDRDVDAVSNDPAHEAGCMAFHPAHEHWHFNDFARYQVRRWPSGEIAGAIEKVSFCMIDLIHQYPHTPGSPPSSYYQGGFGVDTEVGCGPTSTQGISAGWADSYSAQLPDQFIDITAEPKKASLCLVIKADPSNRLLEANENNNVAKTRVRVNGPKVSFSDRTCTART